ncbi:MAG: hypothetical protein LBT01_03915 [Spirochaetaceae bacterium]|jgi:hypothetical protein|nr:hypothetical protein [Spirochaetaceae bacterium]
MNKFVLVAFCALFCSSFLNASPALDKLLSAGLVEKLFATGFLSEAHFDDLTLSFAPKDEALLETIAEAKLAITPSLLIESLCYYTKPEQSSEWTDAERTTLFNGIVSISTLAGLRYYSNSKKGTRLFYEKSYIIDSPERKNKQSDPVFTSDNLPATLTLYAEQKDLTFGNNIYKLDFSIHKEAILFSQRNETNMYYGFLPVLGKEKLHSIIAIIDAGDHILIYMVSMADAMSLLGMKNRIAISFASRTEAVLGWFTEKANAVYKGQP